MHSHPNAKSRVRRRPTLRAAAMAALLLLACFGVPLGPAPRAAAQTPPSPLIEDARSIAAAFRALADVAAEATDDAGWQRADDSYNNTVLAALDIHRPSLLAAGDAARGPLATVDGALFAIGQALDAQDAARIRAEAERVAAAMDILAPGVAGGAPTVGAASASWRDLRKAFGRLADRQRAGEDTWRDMRNAAIALIDDVEARATAVAAAVPSQALTVEQVRVLAYRLRMAALDQSADGAATAGRLLDAALERIDRAATSAGVPDQPERARLWFEGVPVVGQIGQTVALPIQTHGVAEVGGLGGFVLDIRWSPRALRMENVAWNLGDAASSASANDAAAGHYVLELPPAPVGPESDSRVAELNMTILGVTPDPADYVPAEPLSAMNAALDAAEQLVRQGGLAMASARLFDGYAAYVEGRDTRSSLLSRLDGVGHSDPLETAWLAVLDSSSRPEPAGADAVVEGITAARAALAAGVSAYVASLASEGGIPVTIDVLSATDLAGHPVVARPSVAARVLTAGLVTPTAFTANVVGGAVTTPSLTAERPGDAAPGGAPERATAGALAGLPDPGAPSLDASSPGAPNAGAFNPVAEDDTAGGARSDVWLGLFLAVAVVCGGLGAAFAARHNPDPLDHSRR